jgi:hypothetical protein
MTTIQRAAQIFGVVFILVAILGFVSSGASMVADPATAPKVLGLFPVNLLHNVVHVLFGVWGLAASRTVGASVTYGKVGGVIYLILGILGYVSPSGFGFVPLGGHAIWLHLLFGVSLAALGFTHKAATMETPPISTRV